MTTTVFLPQPLSEDKVAETFQALSSLVQAASYTPTPVHPWMAHSARCKCPYCR